VTAPRARLALLVAGLAVLYVVFGLLRVVSQEEVRGLVEGAGAGAPLVFVVVSAVLGALLIPGPLLSAASGVLFGTALGFPVSLAAAVLGASLAFSVSRWWAHDAVAEVAGPRVSAFREFVGRRGFLAVFYARLAPGVPYNAVNYAAGLTPVRLPVFAAATAIGAAPRAFAYTALGGQVGDFGSWQTVVALVVLVGMAIIGLVLAARDPEIAAAVKGLRRKDRSAGPS